MKIWGFFGLFFCTFSSAFTFSPQPFGEICESLPLSGVHVDVLSITDVLVVDDVIVNSFCSFKNGRERYGDYIMSKPCET